MASFHVSITNMNTEMTTRRYSQGARAQAAEATGQRIVEAFLARLMTQWYDEITLDKVAEDAGVTVQTVVRRFRGKEGLLGIAVEVLGTQINTQRATEPNDVDRMVEGLFADYERTGDAIIRLLALEPRHATLKEYLDIGRNFHRQWVSTVFAEPLEKLDGAARKRALDALVVITDVYAWKLLRRDMERSVAVAATTMRSMIQATIAEFLRP
jgi:AcrR family transcriptional regulator